MPPLTDPPVSRHRCGFGSTRTLYALSADRCRPTLLDVRHASSTDLDRISDLLERLRGVSGLVERTPGVFYRRSRAFLHFHEDPAGMFADVRLSGDDFEQFRVSSRTEQALFLRRVRAAVGEETPT